MDASQVTRAQFIKWLNFADTDQDGAVSRDEWLDYAKFALDGSQESAAKLFDDLDADGSGFLTFDEAPREAAPLLRVRDLTEPYPTDEVRITTNPNNTPYGQTYIGIVRKAWQGPGGDWGVTLYQGEYGRNVTLNATGDERVREFLRMYTDETPDRLRTRERNSWTS